jgi:REP element-mobilizing transposase RayT
MPAEEHPQPESQGHRLPRGWHSRGYLPHFDGGSERPQSVTFRLADSVPARVINQWQAEVETQPDQVREAELRDQIETFLDAGYGACHLRDPRIASLVEGALLFFDGVRYRLHAWVVMPNHVHALFTPAVGWNLSDIVGSWKSFTAKGANTALTRTGKFWQEDYFDRFIRDEEHFQVVLNYIEANPVKARLCGKPEEWRFGSARRRTSNADVDAGGSPRSQDKTWVLRAAGEQLPFRCPVALGGDRRVRTPAGAIRAARPARAVRIDPVFPPS